MNSTRTARSRSLLCGLALAAAGLPHIARAQGTEPPAAAASQPAQALPEVKVRAEAEAETATGPALGYSAKRSATATKTDTPLIETPQSVTIVTRERIEDQGATGLQDALNYAAGVRSDAFGLDSRTDSVNVRGSFLDSVYLDGLRRQFGGFYTSTTRVEPYTLERIEVLRGPSAMLFGQGSIAGVLNLVSKRPLDEAYREVGVQLGSYDRRQVQADLTGPLTEDGRWLYRLVALGRKADTQVDHVRDDRAVVAPSLTWRPSAATSLTLQAVWQEDKTASTLQFLPWSGTVAPNPNGRIPTSRFLGEPGFDYYDSTRESVGWLFEHDFSEDWTARQNLRFSRNEVDFRTFYIDIYSAGRQPPNSPYIDAEQRLLDRYQFGGLTEQRLVTVDQHLEGRLNTGDVRHKLLLGLDYARSKTQSDDEFDFPVSQGGGIEPIDAYDPVYTGYTPPQRTQGPETVLRQTGIYLQDQMRIGSWIVMGGLRHDRVSNGVEGSDDAKDSATTKRLGVMYQLPGGWAPYASYSESFVPVAGIDNAGNRFDPQRGEQIEVGVKLQPEGAQYSFTAAAYTLEEDNRLTQDPNDPSNQVQAAEVEVDGIELEYIGRIAPQFELSAHYNYTDARTDSSDVFTFFGGYPEHGAAAWGKYSFSLAGTPGWSAGLGVRYFSSVKDGIAPRVQAQYLFDAALAYDSAAWRYALNVQNLADKTYASACAARGDCFYGARRHVNLTATYRF